ncbi:MAG: Asp-tRNA(Asn)/Glu-tRNA(Gln) amidotransferase subunit GatC [Pseudomonadota bacterium]
MNITKKEIAYVSKLARLKFSEKEAEQFAIQLSNILSYIDTLNTLDTADIQTTSHPLSLNNIFRDDEPQQPAQSLPKTSILNRDTMLQNAPELEDGQYVVPKIIS